MAADEIAVFRPAIREMLDAGEGWCASFNDEEHEGAWVQVSDDLLNFAYPYDKEPGKVMHDLGLFGLDRLETVRWEPGKFATLRLTEMREKTIALAVDQIFANVLRRPPGFKIRVELFHST